MKRSRLALVAAALLSVTAVGMLGGCGEHAPPAAAPQKPKTAQWQDVFDGMPELYAVVRPQAIKRDAVYGSFFKTLLRVAQARTEMTGVTSLEALEGCDEIIVGLRKNVDRRHIGEVADAGDDAAIVARGVPASLDPAKMTDRAGRPLFRLVEDRAKVPEYVFLGSSEVRLGNGGVATGGASLFVLPDRTWVVALGAARGRARVVFAAPAGRAAPQVDEKALAVVRFDAVALSANGRPIERSPLFGPIARKLSSATFALQPARNGLVASLDYKDDDASAWAEMHTKRLLDDVVHADAQPDPSRRRTPGSLAWLKDAKVAREGNMVTVQVPLPARLLEELPNATATDLSL